MMLSVIVVGAGGRMGRLIMESLLDGRGTDMALAAAVVRQGSPMAGKKVSEVIDKQGTGGDLIITDDLSSAFKNIKEKILVIDFSTAESATHHAKISAEHHGAYLLGTTGLTDEQVEKIKTHARQIPIMIAPNTSFGVMVLKKLVTIATDYLAGDYAMTMKETHHVDKKDKPSGTALMLGRAMESRTDKKITYQSIRQGTEVGRHEIMFDGVADSITLIHQAKNRQLFALGALVAGRWLCQQPSGFYKIDDMLEKPFQPL